MLAKSLGRRRSLSRGSGARYTGPGFRRGGRAYFGLSGRGAARMRNDQWRVQGGLKGGRSGGRRSATPVAGRSAARFWRGSRASARARCPAGLRLTAQPTVRKNYGSSNGQEEQKGRSKAMPEGQ